jgi:RimJ/RimL family protein N-acetyltransferase
VGCTGGASHLFLFYTETAMSENPALPINIRPWRDDDYALMQRLLGDPAMTVHLGGPESAQKLRQRLARYVAMQEGEKGQMFVIVVGPEQTAAGSAGYWEKEWQGELVWETGWSVLPEFQGLGVATKAMAAIIELARREGRHRSMHAYPSIHNSASNAICRKLGFALLGEYDFEYPPGTFMRCNDWALELLPERG